MTVAPWPLHRIAIMDDNKINLDDEAERLFSQFEGMEDQRKGRSAAELMAESLLEEQKQQDVWRILICDIAHRIAGYLKPAGQDSSPREQDQLFTQLSETLSKLSQLPHHAGRILIRYRGLSSDREIPEKKDYEILFGNMAVDLELVPPMIKRNGQLFAHLMENLLDAFGTLSENGINNLSLNLPLGDGDSKAQLKKSLLILSAFYRAQDRSGDLAVEAEAPTSVPVAVDENGAADPNLTLVGGLNRLSAGTMKNLVSKNRCLDAGKRGFRGRVSFHQCLQCNFRPSQNQRKADGTAR